MSEKYVFDRNFKLTVIEPLLNEEVSFKDKLEELKNLSQEYWDKYNADLSEEYDETEHEEHVKNALNIIDRIEFSKEDLEKVEMLYFDGGCEIYHLIYPDFGGYEDIFDIHSIQGIEYLPNLKSVSYISMIDESLIDDIQAMGINVC